MDTDWLDKEQYPFKPNYFEVPEGRLHFVDEGDGSPVVFVHGNPTWSFLYRRLIDDLAKNYRCIALDLMGFGLSDKPRNWSYLPQDHARHFELFIESLDLSEITLVVHDFGGPIGLSYAIAKPEEISRLVLLNTFMWSLNGNIKVQLFSRAMANPIGRWLCLKRNFFTRAVMPAVFGNKSALTAKIRTQYLSPHTCPDDRIGTWAFPVSLVKSKSWYDHLWSRQDRLAPKPALLVWGMKDPAFGRSFLRKWQRLFDNPRTIEFEKAGHYVLEEESTAIMWAVREFLDNND